MSLYIPFVFAVFLIFVVFYVVAYRKNKVFQKNINLSASLSFAQSSDRKGVANYGSIVFTIHSVSEDYKGFCIENVLLNTNRIKLRSYSRLYAKLPLNNKNNDLSIDFLGNSKEIERRLDKLEVVVEGYLVDSEHKKVSFKKKLPLIEKNVMLFQTC